jgi:uncharacterized membrane protein
MVRLSFSIVIPVPLVLSTSNSVIKIGSNQSQITMAQRQQVTKVT